MQIFGDSAMSLMCQKTATNVSPSAAFISFGIRIFKHLGLERKVEVDLLASGARILNLIQFSGCGGGLKDLSHSHFVPCS